MHSTTCDPRNGKPKYILLDIIFYIILFKITANELKHLSSFVQKSNEKTWVMVSENVVKNI